MTAPVTSNTSVMVMTSSSGITINNNNNNNNSASSNNHHSCHHLFGVFDDYLKHCHESCSRYSDWDRLLFACQQNKRDVVQYLIEEGGVDPSYCNPMKQSALHIAARYGHVECLEYVLQCIPPERRLQAVNSKNRLSGATPLHCCLQRNAASSSSSSTSSSSGNKETSEESISRRMSSVRLLLQAGANLEVHDALGKTPLDYWNENFVDATTTTSDDNVASPYVLLGEELRRKVTV